MNFGCKFSFHNLFSGDDNYALLREDTDISAKNEVDREGIKPMSVPSLIIPRSPPVDNDGWLKHSEGETLPLSTVPYKLYYSQCSL